MVYSSEYYVKHKERIKKEQKEYRVKNRERLKDRGREYRSENRERYMLHTARNRSKKMGIPFNIEVSDINIPKTCPALGMPLIFGEGRQQDNSPSLDRLVPELGYVKGNVIVVSNKANRIKNDATLRELRQVVNFYEGLLDD